jgi:hypothetical protein
MCNMGNLRGVNRRIQIIETQHTILSNTNKKTLFKVLLVRVYVRKISINRVRIQKMLDPTIPTGKPAGGASELYLDEIEKDL